MLTTTAKSFILLMNDRIEAVTTSFEDMKIYCAETKKKGTVYVIESVIPFGGKISDIVTTQKIWAAIE